MAEGARLFALGVGSYWMDIGTPQKYLAANMDALAGRFLTSANGGPPDGATMAAEGARVDPDANVVTTCLGRGARVESGATVEASVLLPGAVVGRGATVIRSILGEGARVAPGGRAVDATVADGLEVPA